MVFDESSRFFYTIFISKPVFFVDQSHLEHGANLTSEHNKKSKLIALTLAAVGIVYGDIGTSPLYTLKTIFDPVHGLALTTPNLLGIVSLIFWGLTMIVSLKYVTLVLRADNRGEGGIMALMALALNSVTRSSRWHYVLMVLGVFGATMPPAARRRRCSRRAGARYATPAPRARASA